MRRMPRRWERTKLQDFRRIELENAAA